MICCCTQLMRRLSQVTSPRMFCNMSWLIRDPNPSTSNNGNTGTTTHFMCGCGLPKTQCIVNFFFFFFFFWGTDKKNVIQFCVIGWSFTTLQLWHNPISENQSLSLWIYDTMRFNTFGYKIRLWSASKFEYREYLKP